MARRGFSSGAQNCRNEVVIGALTRSGERLTHLDWRRGDADDNRASPYGRGMGRVVPSAALDFNILKASFRSTGSHHWACFALRYCASGCRILGPPEATDSKRLEKPPVMNHSLVGRAG